MFAAVLLLTPTLPTPADPPKPEVRVIRVGKTVYEIDPEAVFLLDDVSVPVEKFLTSVQEITVVEVKDGRVVRLEGRSK